MAEDFHRQAERPNASDSFNGKQTPVADGGDGFFYHLSGRVYYATATVINTSIPIHYAQSSKIYIAIFQALL